MKNNTETWWKIKFYSENNFNHSNEHYHHVYLEGYDAILINDHLVDIDNRLFYYPYKIESVIRSEYFIELFQEILNTFFENQDNYYGTWKQLERFFPDVICNKLLNTQDIINQKVIRFFYNNVLYEYSSFNKTVNIIDHTE